MTTWLLPIEKMTAAQRQAISLPTHQNHFIFGPPGSGKTQVLVHRAALLRRKFGGNDAEFRILVYTNVLKKYIRSALELLDIPTKAVTTYDDWCHHFHIQHISPVIPWNEKRNHPDFSAIRAAVAHCVALNKVRLPLYNFVLVDEGQDLDAMAFQTLRRVARHVTVCFDNKQQIYPQGSTEATCLAALGLQGRSLSLTDAYRCTPGIVRLAAQLLPDHRTRNDYLSQVRVAPTEGETPLLYQAGNSKQEIERLVEVLQQRLLVDQNIGILVPMRKLVFSFTNKLKEAHIDVEPQNALDFTSSRPKLMTYHSAKGLMFDSVLLPCLSLEYFPNKSLEELTHLLFVAITRASRWVYLSTSEDAVFPLLQAFTVLSKENLLVFQSHKATHTHKKTESKPREQEKDTLDFL
ncbi:MAG TPA: 3'-5' exonuclease [Candidatus Hydrogenedentes bacterium]|nr:3'-5' exonuclease [Candidatus Hydrogenedentota bacterium]HOL76775.1 3'-5' exonuclease [Candidatus Hydrogenedentota bacterium]HPO85748.1 3'-5' exonuclease [Candidatus Hydrogenedentota bacterium]